jgi:hypothetical protein
VVKRLSPRKGLFLRSERLHLLVYFEIGFATNDCSGAKESVSGWMNGMERNGMDGAGGERERETRGCDGAARRKGPQGGADGSAAARAAARAHARGGGEGRTIGSPRSRRSRARLAVLRRKSPWLPTPPLLRALLSCLCCPVARARSNVHSLRVTLGRPNV